MSGQVVRVKREVLEACMTCPLCNKLLRDATTISLCLHTFCRKCIYEKLSDEEDDICPVCEIDLGCLPVEKLRADHNLQDIRAKLFPYKRKKVQAAPEVTPSITVPPTKRKERSLSSLVVNTPKMPIQTGMTGRRSRAGSRKASSFIKKEYSSENHPMSSSSPESPNRSFRNKRQDSPGVDRSTTKDTKEEPDDDVEVNETKADLWTPLNCLVEAANRSKPLTSNSQGVSLFKSELPDNENGHRPKSKQKEYGHYMKAEDENNGTNLLQTTVKRRRLTSRKRAAMSEEISVSAQVMVDAPGAKSYRRNCPIWFSLVASEDRNGDASLPQISSCYIRIKDGKMPVSFIQKYLVKKLDLNSEAEVEIMCRGQPVLPTQELHNLVDLWFRTASPAKKVPAFVGSSTKDFVMVLSYCRKV